MLVYSANKTASIKDATWIQGVGYVKGKPAGEIQIGDITVWNCGETAEILSKESETKKTITFSLLGSDGWDGKKVYQRTFLKTRIVAIGNIK